MKQTFIFLVMILLCFGGSLVASMNNQQCMVRSTLIDLYLDEVHYYPFIIIKNRCDGSCNAIEDSIVFLNNGRHEPESIQHNQRDQRIKDTRKTYPM